MAPEVIEGLAVATSRFWLPLLPKKGPTPGNPWAGQVEAEAERLTSRRPEDYRTNLGRIGFDAGSVRDRISGEHDWFGDDRH